MSGYGNSQEDLLNSSLITNTGSSSLSTVVVDENTKKLTEVKNNDSNVTDGDSTETAYDTTSQNFEEEVEKENQFENDTLMSQIFAGTNCRGHLFSRDLIFAVLHKNREIREI